jgi:small subunit ribosomal protein S11
MTEEKTTEQKEQAVEPKEVLTPVEVKSAEKTAAVSVPQGDPLADPLIDTSTADVSTEEGEDDKKVIKKRPVNSKPARQVSLGRAYIKSSYNNTIVTFTDQNGNVLAWSSAGQCGFKGPKKATPYAATMIVKDAYEKARKHGLKEVAVFVKGVGGGRDAAIRALNANGLTVGGIKDITPIPHNGCRAKKPRRV